VTIEYVVEAILERADVPVLFIEATEEDKEDKFIFQCNNLRINKFFFPQKCKRPGTNNPKSIFRKKR